MDEENIISVENEIQEDTEAILADLKSQLEDSQMKKWDRITFSKESLLKHIDMMAMKFDAISGYKAAIDALEQLGMDCMAMHFDMIRRVCCEVSDTLREMKLDVESNIDNYDAYPDLLDKFVDFKITDTLEAFSNEAAPGTDVAFYLVSQYLKSNACSSISDIMDSIVEFNKRADEEIQRIQDEIDKIEHGE